LGGSTGAQHRVAVLTEVAAVQRAFDYDVPAHFDGPLEPGSRVRVPFHGRSVEGWVLGPGQEQLAEAKPLARSLGMGPTSEILDLARWAAWRWAGSWERFVRSASPETIVRALPTAPPKPILVSPPGALAALGASSAQERASMVVRMGPCTDPFDAVLGFLAGQSQSGEAGSVLVLVPGKGYATRLVARLSRRGLPTVEASEQWAAVRAGWPVVVGTRTAVLASVPELSGIIILDADDPRFYSEAAPTWNAVELARQRCAGRVPLMLVSSCPSALQLEGSSLVTLADEREGWPLLSVVDQLEEDPRSGTFSARFVALARTALDEVAEGVAVACVVNRKGRARLVVCSRCDQIARCERCQAACGLDEQLHCPRCEATRPVICASCGATKMKLLRLGTSQLSADLAALLGREVVELTAASPPEALDGARVVLGTDAVLHRVRSARLVAFLDLDHHLLAPVAGAELRSLTMLGRAGRLVGGRGARDPGTLLVQTRMVEHPVVRAAQRGDPSEVIDSDVAVRRLLGLAPFGSVARLKGPGAAGYGALLEAKGLECSVLGPEDLLVKAGDVTSLAEALSSTPRPREALRVAVDPESL
jgi:primosomal protein N' (replication factor Y)